MANLYENIINDMLGQILKSKGTNDQTTGNIGCKVQNPIQPTDNVGEFGNSEVINIKESDDGCLEIDSKEIAIKLSAVVYEAIKSYLNKGEE